MAVTYTTVIQERLETDLQAFLIALNLTGTPGTDSDIGTNVYVHLLPEQLSLKFPCVLITTIGETEEEGDSTFEEDFVVYPVKLLILDSVQPNYQARRADYSFWRRQIAAALRGLVASPLLPNCPELHDVRLRNLAIIDDRMPEAQLVKSGLVALCHTNETRQRNG